MKKTPGRSGCKVLVKENPELSNMCTGCLKYEKCQGAEVDPERLVVGLVEDGDGYKRVLTRRSDIKKYE